MNCEQLEPLHLKKQLTDYLQKDLQRDQVLLDAIKTHLPELESLLFQCRSDYEDRMYRFYYQSFKVYSLQESTMKAVDLSARLGAASESKLCHWFEEIVAEGTGSAFDVDHNENWTTHTRPIVEAFLHAKYFVEMMVKYGNEIDAAQTVLPTGWAAILCLYNQR
jgi:hypothetical protein